MIDVILDTLVDGFKLLPFLFTTYLVMEYLEHKTGEHTKQMVKKAGRFGPIIGSVLGIVPQCGFSAAASNLYAGRIITVGTLISIYLSTSDEMLPILISESVPFSFILKILLIKVVIGVCAGIIIDVIVWKVRPYTKITGKDATHPDEWEIHSLCEKEHCHCEKGIISSAINHTLQIFSFIVFISFLLNMIIYFIGEDSLSGIILNQPVIAEFLAGLVGLIPNCAASVIITQLYLEGAMSTGAMLSGLLVSAGVGLLVLFRVNSPRQKSWQILGILYVCGVAAGIIFDLFGFVI